MAQIVSIIGITHNPFMPRLFQQPQQPPGAAKVKERVEMMRKKLADANPEVLITIVVRNDSIRGSQAPANCRSNATPEVPILCGTSPFFAEIQKTPTLDKVSD